MIRIEVNVATGERTLLDLSPEEIADAEARTAALQQTPNQVIISQIAAIEAGQPTTQRALRELMLVIGQAFPAAQSSVFYKKAAAQEGQVAALRDQLT